MNPPLPNITFLTKVLVLAGVVQLISADDTVEGRPGEILEAKNPRVVQSSSQLSLPLFWAIRDPQVREELNLSREQFADVGRIGAEFVKGCRDDWAGVLELEPEQRQEKFDQIRQNRQRRLALVQRRLREILTDEQIDTLLMAQLRVRGIRALFGQPAAPVLRMTDEQRKQIQQKTAAMNQKMRALQQELQKVQQEMQQLRDETFDDAIQVLTPEQLERLKRLEATGNATLDSAQVQTLSTQARPAAARPQQPARVQPQRVQPNTRPAPSLQNRKPQPHDRNTITDT